MTTTITIHDETTSGEKKEAITLEFTSSLITVDEIIKKRIYQEVTEHNAKGNSIFRGLVQPNKAEIMLNGKKQEKKKKIDWEVQYKAAIESFKTNGIILLINNKQADSLEQEFEIKLDTEISFLKLVPLVGG
ncbi:MAG: hypothetical protein COA79_21820 [Planctomycetota bacterium]|nr:MAG: hypothetical protein COA79_21820 [Planctomycetota bacterium]